MPAPLGDAWVSDESIDRLEALLAAGDYDSVALFRQLASSLHQQFGASIGEVQNKLRNFEFDAARVALRALRASARR